MGAGAKEDSPIINSAASVLGGSEGGVSHYETPVTNAANKIATTVSSQPKHNSLRIPDAQETDQSSKMSLAKQVHVCEIITARISCSVPNKLILFLISSEIKTSIDE